MEAVIAGIVCALIYHRKKLLSKDKLEKFLMLP
jgi:hypothetical protein